MKDCFKILVVLLAILLVTGCAGKMQWSGSESAETKTETEQVPPPRMEEQEVITTPMVDTDSDGVADENDRCPGSSAGVAVDENGCPKDTDKDGVPDSYDKCPATPMRVVVDPTGCPQPVMQLLVLFPTDQFEVPKAAAGHLQKVGAFMQQHPETKGILQGHTDNVGSKYYNLDLSKKRAESVKRYLVDHFNISPDRLKTVGYGLTKPVANNKKPEGRQRNRRVEAVIR